MINRGSAKGGEGKEEVQGLEVVLVENLTEVGPDWRVTDGKGDSK